METTIYDRIECVEGDLTEELSDAIVNAANEELRGGGGVDAAIHKVAGPKLMEECRERYPDGCPTGEARITSGHDLPAKYVIHAVGPRYSNGSSGENAMLVKAYRSSLQVAIEAGAKSISFPAISCGAYSYPWGEAANVAISTVQETLSSVENNIETVRFVLFGPGLFQVFSAELDRLRPS